MTWLTNFHIFLLFSPKWMFPFFLVDDFAFCTRFFMYYSGTVSQEDKIETLKRSSRLIHYCAAPLLFHPDWRKLRSSYAPENSTVTPEETSSEDKKQETKERKTSKAQKTIDGECQRIVIRICESSYWVSFLFFGVTPPPHPTKGRQTRLTCVATENCPSRLSYLVPSSALR